MSRCTLDTAMSLTFSLTGLSPSPAGLSRTVLLTFGNQLCSPNPEMHASRFGLFRFRSPLLTESIVFFRKSFLFFPPATYMFKFTGLPPYTYGFSIRYMRSSHVGFPIQISVDQWLFAPPHSFSQLITSFIGSQCQGIHPALLFA